MSYHPTLGEITRKPPASAVVMPLFLVGAVGIFLYIFRKEVFAPQRKAA